MQGTPQKADSDEPEQALPDVTLAATVANLPLSRPIPAPVDSGDLESTYEHVSETDSEDASPLGGSGPLAYFPEAQPREVVEAVATLPTPQPLSQPVVQPQFQERPQLFLHDEQPLSEQLEGPAIGLPSMQQAELKRARTEVGRYFGLTPQGSS